MAESNNGIGSRRRSLIKRIPTSVCSSYFDRNHCKTYSSNSLSPSSCNRPFNSGCCYMVYLQQISPSPFGLKWLKMKEIFLICLMRRPQPRPVMTCYLMLVGVVHLIGNLMPHQNVFFSLVCEMLFQVIWAKNWKNLVALIFEWRGEGCYSLTLSQWTLFCAAMRRHLPFYDQMWVLKNLFPWMCACFIWSMPHLFLVF